MEEIPDEIVDAVHRVGVWFADKNIRHWQLGHCASRMQLLETQAEVERLRAGEAFHRVAVAQRNAAWAEIERLQAALKDICNPLDAWKRDLEPGAKLNGAACVGLLNDPETYKRIARRALEDEK